MGFRESICAEVSLIQVQNENKSLEYDSKLDCANKSYQKKKYARLEGIDLR